MPESTEPAPSTNKAKQTAYLVCEGALCQCAAGAAPVKLKVTSHKKAYINNNKLLATEKDVTFDEQGHFGTCSFKVYPSNACVPAVQQWLKPYKDIEVENNKVLTDQSQLMCSTGGTITIKMHGQQQTVNAGQAENMDRTIATQVNPLADLAPLAEAGKKVKVNSITGELVDDPKYKPVTTQKIQTVKSVKESPTDKDPSDICVRPGQEIKFTAQCEGTEPLVCWKLQGKAEPIYFLQHGPVYKTGFPEVGKYVIEGYGTGIDSNLDVDTQINKDNKRVLRGTTYTECMLDILVQNNKLIGIRHLESKNIIPGKVDNKAGIHVRIGVPVTFEPVYLMPPIQEEIDHLILVIKDAAGNEVQRSKGAPNIVFAAQNSAVNYKVEAYFDNSEAAPFTYPFRTAHNTVSVVAASGLKEENDKIRPGTKLTFSVSKFKFADEELQEEVLNAELDNIRWYENADAPVAIGKTTYSNIYQKEGEYIVTCSVKAKSAGWFTLAKNKDEADDWHFKVTRNYPTAIEKKTEGKVKVGKKITFELKGIFEIDHTDAATITWQLTGPDTITTKGSYAFVFTPRKNGAYVLTATMNGQSKDFDFECITCEIVKGWWTDADGNILTGKDDEEEPKNTIGFAGWEQEVVAAFKHVGLNDEEVTLEVFQKNNVFADVSVFKKDVKVLNTGNGATCSVKLDASIKDKIKKNSAIGSEDALLYFTVKAKNGLKVINDGMMLPESGSYLNVDGDVRIKTYFADNNDTRRYSTASLDTPVYIQVKSTNLIGEELELEIWKSIDWESDKALGSRFTFKVDKYGMASLKLNMKLIKPELPTPKDSVSIYVKIYNKNTRTELTGEFTFKLTMYKTLATSASSIGTTKAFVVVDASKGEKNKVKENDCYCLKQGAVKKSCNGDGCLISEENYNLTATKLGVEVEIMKAIAKQESKRNSFWEDGQATILFERHKMWIYLKESGKTQDELEVLKEKYPKIVNNSAGEYGAYSEQYEKLKIAKQIDYSSALKSCSWGKFQVMGFNYKVSFSSPEEMEMAVNKCELQQFKFFIGYLENTNGLIQAIKDKDWELIAKKYNGASWKATNPDYASNIEKYYDELK